jgi:hypothetical protein
MSNINSERENSEYVQRQKRQRRSTGGASVEHSCHSTSNSNIHSNSQFQPAMDFEHIKQLPVDEKLNFIFENISMMGLRKYRVDTCI